MSSKKVGKLTKEEIQEIRNYIKKLREGSTTGGVPGYQTPAAFTGNSDGDGTETVDLEQGQFAYSAKAPKDHPHTIKLHEVSYRDFRDDRSVSEVKKVNNRILEVSKMLREISRALDHSIKLKQESALDNSKYWKKTNEAILKIKDRISEINKKAGKLANLKELAANSIKDKLVQLFNTAGIRITANDVDYNTTGTDQYEFDIMIAGEPYAIDYERGQLIYQSYDKEIPLGDINQDQQVIDAIAKTFK
jgi:hypothetical protein